MIASLVDRGMIALDSDLAGLTTYKFGGPARYYAEPESESELLEVARAIGDASLAVLVLGRGSNLVIADDGFDGVVIHLGSSFGGIGIDDAGRVLAGAAAPLASVARFGIEPGRGGLEFFVGIPGSVGGAVRMNAGCHGSETREFLQEARVVDLVQGTVTERTPVDLELGYRSSNLLPTDVVVAATFRTTPSDSVAVRDRIREITVWRREHQPGGTYNAGSVFRNPPGDSAGRIIDALGLKGFRVGQVSVSDRHANFFVADEGASAQDLYDLVWAVRRSVGEARNVWLEPEIQFVGEFRPSPEEGFGT